MPESPAPGVSSATRTLAGNGVRVNWNQIQDASMRRTSRQLYLLSTGGAPCLTTPTLTNPFTRSSKRRKGFPSETQVKKGIRIVHGEKELLEKLGRNDPCPCGSRRRFQELLHESWHI